MNIALKRIKNVSLLLLITSCAVEVKNIPPPVELAPRFSQTGVEVLKSRWWESFNDKQLNQLINRALENNFSLKAAFNRVQKAQAVAKKSGAGLMPTLEGSFSSSRQLNENITQDNFSLGLSTFYELDLWGRIRANLKAATLDIYVSEEDLYTAAIALTAEITTAWYRLQEQHQQFKLLNSQIEINQQLTQLTELRFAAGSATAADVLQQQQALESIVGSQYPILSQIQVLEHQLAILLGQAPKSLNLKPRGFPQLLALPKTGLSADLIQRRPDLRQAYLKVQAADLRIAAAIAERFPKLSLSASINTSAPDLQSLFNNWLATLAGNLVLPIIDGSRRVAEVERTEAHAQEQLNLYAQALLRAVKEVEDALVQESQQQQLVHSLAKQVKLSQQASEQIRLRYRYGAIDFLRVLSVVLSQQGLERNYLRAQRELIEYRINLHRALAGSFELPESLTKNTE